MNSTKGKPYRIFVAIIFGMAGFVINFLDLQLLESPELKISILAGLYFPLVIALAWGWRYGLLSALAGGCQSMWWLWRNDGWGIFYAVPVFSLWIIWHGWWAERRGENHSWHQSCFAVEIPFRIGIEFGFYTIFRWLVSLNPPLWNPAITWNYVPMSWVHTVVIKHAITAYILLLAAYVTVNVGPVRRLFGLQHRIAQRDTNAIYAAAILMGVVLWMMDSVADYLIFNPGGRTFWEVTILETGPHDIFIRSLYIIVSLVGAVFIAHIVHQRSILSYRLSHLNKVLRSIRNVNQLITKENDQNLLIQGACENLVKNRGYTSAWIALMGGSGKCIGAAHAGIGEVVFQKLKKDLESGHMPACAQKALAQSGGVVIKDPHLVCGDCPLAYSYETYAPLSIRLEYQGEIFGVLSTSMPGNISWDFEELELFEELGGDIAFALYGIEREGERKKAEKALYETEYLYRTHFENVNDVIYSVDRELKVINISPSVESVLGYKPGELIGRPLQELNVLPPEYIEQVVADIMFVFSGNRIPSVEYQFIAKDGTRKWGEVSGAPLIRDGKVAATISVARDVTDRKEAEKERDAAFQQLRVTNQQLEASNQQLSATEQELRESGEFIRAVLDNLPVGIGVNSVDPAVEFSYMNDSFPRIYRTTREALAERDTFWEAVYEDPVFRGDIKKRVLDDCASGDPKRMSWEEVPIAREGEETSFVSARNILVPGKDLAISMVWDVTERKWAEDELRRSEQRLRSSARELNIRNQIAQVFLTVADDDIYAGVLDIILEAMASKHGVFGYLDKDGNLVVPTMTRTAWAQCQVSDKAFVFPRETWIGSESSWPRAIREKRTIFQNEHSTRTPPGHVPVARHISMPLLHQGRVVGLIQVANSETDYGEEDVLLLETIGGAIAPILDAKLRRIRAERQLRELNTTLEQRVRERTAQLEAANKELEAFAYSVSHDLRAPLRSINGFSEALLEDYADKVDEQGKDHLRRVRAGAQRMGELIEDLLKLSRITRWEMEHRKVDITALARQTVASLRQSQPERNVYVVIEDGLAADGDIRLFRVVIENLVGNAWKFSSGTANARIEIGRLPIADSGSPIGEGEAGDARGGAGQSKIQNLKSEIVFFVRDNGVGFDMAYVDKLFGAFQRLHSTAEFEGTGIDLATVQRAVLRHGGRVWAEGEVGKGATFYFTLK